MSSSPCWYSPPAPAGKERLFLEAARVLQRRIYVSVAKRKVGCLEKGERRSAAGVAAVARRRRGQVEGAYLSARAGLSRAKIAHLVGSLKRPACLKRPSVCST